MGCRQGEKSCHRTPRITFCAVIITRLHSVDFRCLWSSRVVRKGSEFGHFGNRRSIMLGWAIALPIVGTYIITSVVLLNFPWLVHKKKKLKFRCRHISHRGGKFRNVSNLCNPSADRLTLTLNCNVKSALK